MHDVYLICIAGGVIAVIGLLFMLAGGWVHHRGVLVGKGSNDQFIGNPKGEVFRIETPGEFQPEEPEKDKNLDRVLTRLGKFKQSMGGK